MASAELWKGRRTPSTYAVRSRLLAPGAAQLLGQRGQYAGHIVLSIYPRPSFPLTINTNARSFSFSPTVHFDGLVTARVSFHLSASSIVGPRATPLLHP